MRKLRDKEYRHEFLSASVRGGVAYQMQSLRRQDGSSQQRFSAKVGKTQTQISRLEDTEYPGCTVQTLIDVASALGIGLVIKFVSLDVMLRETEDSSDSAFAVVPVDQMELDGPDEAEANAKPVNVAAPKKWKIQSFELGATNAALIDTADSLRGGYQWLLNQDKSKSASTTFRRGEAPTIGNFTLTT